MKITLKLSENKKNNVRMLPVFSNNSQDDLAGLTPDLFPWEMEMMTKLLDENSMEKKLGEQYSMSQLHE